jgi:hypothetical protein
MMNKKLRLPLIWTYSQSGAASWGLGGRSGRIWEEDIVKKGEKNTVGRWILWTNFSMLDFYSCSVIQQLGTLKH